MEPTIKYVTPLCTCWDHWVKLRVALSAGPAADLSPLGSAQEASLERDLHEQALNSPLRSCSAFRVLLHPQGGGEKAPPVGKTPPRSVI